MPIKNYGVWKATPTSFTAERSDRDPISPHGHLKFKDGVSSRPLSSAINVKSISEDSRLVYWLVQDLDHPLKDKLSALEFGWHDIAKDDRGPPDGIALDYLRSGIVQVESGRLLPHDVPGDQNDIVDFLLPFFDKAIQKGATVYLYGEQYSREDGVHDIHMNQGSGGRFRNQNGIYQDGGVLLEFPDGHWEAFFIAFASQAVKTDERGHGAGPVFGEFLDAPANPAPGDGGNDRPTEPRPDVPDREGNGHGEGTGSGVSIEAALVNPDGPDGDPNPELVFLVNSGQSTVSLKGWTIGNHMGASTTLPARSKLAARGAKERFESTGVALSNRGGSITLKSADGSVVDEVRYTREQASRSGKLVYFK
ncbi:hypothetical protein HJFPF1_11808 [Paramyrothecium foliicola]|nr:hypothetical protein HJFPF1_11808 [Paramyrothecium foliicola]